MKVYNIHEAKTQLSKIVEGVYFGEEVIIAKAEKPKIKLSSVKKKEQTQVYVSLISFWEIVIKRVIGKLSMSIDNEELAQIITHSGLKIRPLRTDHFSFLEEFPLFHRDLFDRMLKAQCLAEPLHLLTHDTKLKHYSDAIILI